MTAEHSVIEWDNLEPLSVLYKDRYFSKSGGLNESRHVFLDGSNLDQRWNRDLFVIGEIGFGTGLNFLATIERWIKQPRGQLKYIAFESHPLSASEILRALQPFQDIQNLVQEFLPVYEQELKSNLLKFEFPLVFPQWRASLHLIIGDAQSTLESNPHHEVNAWYLDGFSPAKNPELWSYEILKQIKNHSAPSATFATYTAAGWVRRNLIEAGFEVSKQKGFGTKREMLVGRAL